MLSKKSRTKSTIWNASASIVENIIKLIIKFASRYVFIYTLGNAYLGVNALFSSVITMLSLADLGFSIALPQSLYKPLAEKDEKRVCQLMGFYAKVYNAIAVVVFLLGLSILPFLNLVIGSKDTTGIDNISLIYILFVINSAVSYLFVYKKLLFTADQKHYYVALIDTITGVVSTILQIVVLLVWKNYIAFLVVSTASIVLQNLLVSHQCDKYYPYIKEGSKNIVKLPKEEATSLWKKVYALFIYKVASAVETGTDNLIMTSFAGLIITGLCSNYTLIITSMTSILMMVMSAATASIGNLIVTESKSQTYEVYSELNFISFWVYSVCAICLFTLIDPFINIWLGDGYLVETSTVAMLCINFYICGVQNVNSNFRNAYGLFYEGRYRPVLMIIINIVSSIVLAKQIGVTGIFVGTFLSRILTVGTFDPYIVFKYGLKVPLKNYYLSHGVYHIITLAVGAIIYYFSLKWNTTTIFMWILKAAVVFTSVNIIYLLVFHRTKNFTKVVNRLRGVLHAR